MSLISEHCEHEILKKKVFPSNFVELELPKIPLHTKNAGITLMKIKSKSKLNRNDYQQYSRINLSSNQNLVTLDEERLKNVDTLHKSEENNRLDESKKKYYNEFLEEKIGQKNFSIKEISRAFYPFASQYSYLQEMSTPTKIKNINENMKIVSNNSDSISEIEKVKNEKNQTFYQFSKKSNFSHFNKIGGFTFHKNSKILENNEINHNHFINK